MTPDERLLGLEKAVATMAEAQAQTAAATGVLTIKFNALADSQSQTDTRLNSLISIIERVAEKRDRNRIT